MDNQLENRIVDLESRLMFLQHTVDELNTIVTKQQDKLDEMQRHYLALAEQAKQAQLEKDVDSKPPHY